MSRISNAFTVQIVDGPAWMVATVGQWQQIPNTALSSITSRPGSACCDAWNGGSMDESSSTYWLVAAGGHMDSSWNGAVQLSLEAASPTWVEVFNGSSSVQQSVCRYADGRPTSAHTYYGTQFIEQLGYVIRFSVGSRYGDGSQCGTVDAFNTATGDYTRPGYQIANLPYGPPGSGAGASTCKISATGDVWIYTSDSQYRLYKWSRSTNTYGPDVVISPFGLNSDEVPLVHDSTRNKLICFSRLSSSIRDYNIDSGTWGSVQSWGGGSGSLARQYGAVYVPAIDRVLVMGGGTNPTVYQINPVTKATSVFATFSSANGGSIPLRNANYTDIGLIFSSFIYAPRLGGIFYMPRWNQNCWFLKVHN